MPRACDDFMSDLSGIAIGGPCEVRHLLNGADVRSWITMTVETHCHVQRLHLFHFYHLVNAPMAAYAAHANRYVRLMIEENEVRHPVDAHPLDRFTGGVAIAHFLQARACGFTRAWQFMQTSVAGTAAWPDLLAV